MNSLNIKSSFARYATGTFGLILVAIGVALSIKSDLGTAPISCPPYVVSLAGHFQIGSFTIGTVGQYTMLMHLIFIVLQILLLRSRFRLEHLMQIPAAIVFGLLTDASIWAFSWVSANTYAMQLILMALSIVITALGISLEVKGNAWMLDVQLFHNMNYTTKYCELRARKRRLCVLVTRSLSLRHRPTAPRCPARS